MVKKIFIISFILAVLLTACGTPTLAPGNRVSIKEAKGCTMFASYAGEWTGCQPVRVGTGVIEMNPEMKTWEYQGRIRVRLSTGEVLWFQSTDVVSSPPIVAAQK